MIDPLSLATSLTVFLSPALPFLVKGGEVAAGEIGKDTWGKAKTIWSKLFSNPDDKTRLTALETAEAVAALPENKALQSVWQEELKKILEADSTLADELASLICLDKIAKDGEDNVQVQVFGNRNKTIGKVHGQDVDIKM
jgi:hypothetical protein